MVTDNLGIIEVTAAQDQKEVTINAALQQLDNATQDGLPITITGDKTLTATEFNNNFLFELSGSPSAFTLNVTANKRTFAVENLTGVTCTVQVVGGGGTSSAVLNTERKILYCDAVNVEEFTGTGSTTWLGLTDTPSVFTNKSGQGVEVNTAETALVFSPFTIKKPVRAATTVDGTLATAYENTDVIDGVTLATGDRILLKNQSAGAENGIYTVNASGAPTRTDDFDDNDDPVFGCLVPVVEGTENANGIWQLTTAGPYTIGTTALVFAQSSGGGGAGTVNSIKQAVRAATTVNGALTTAYENTDVIDGVTLATGDRILLKNQSTGAENGIYTVNATGAPTRATDFDESAELERGVLVSVIEGTANANSVYQMTTAGPYTIDTTALTFVLVSGGNNISTVQFVIDGGGSTITTGTKGFVEVPFGATITAVRLLADQSGSIVVDIWKDTYANYPPTDADSITASAVPTITTAVKSEDTTLTGWTTSISAGDILGFNVDSATTITKLTLSLTLSR
jgi:hypothetical protein